jgi:hypothetical protein
MFPGFFLPKYEFGPVQTALSFAAVLKLHSGFMREHPLLCGLSAPPENTLSRSLKHSECLWFRD